MNHDRPGLPSLFHGLTPSLLRLLANADVHEDNRSAGSNHATPRPCTPRQVSRRWRWWRSSPIARPSRATSSAARLSRMRRTVSARRSRTSTKPRASPVCRYRSVEDVDLPYATYGAVRLGRPARISSGPLPPGCRPRSRLRRRCVLEQTPVTAVESGGPCQVRTAGGTVTAQTGRRGHPLPAARPWPLLRPPRAEPLVLHRGALPGHAAAGDVDIGRRDHALGSLLRRPAHPRGRGAHDRRAASRSGRYERLERFAREHWEIDKFSHRWSAQDPTRWDLLPVIGRYHPRSSRLFVASGFNKWGLTSGTFAARIIRDLIAGRPSSWTDVFDPNRIGARGARSWRR